MMSIQLLKEFLNELKLAKGKTSLVCNFQFSMNLKNSRKSLQNMHPTFGGLEVEPTISRMEKKLVKTFL